MTSDGHQYLLGALVYEDSFKMMRGFSVNEVEVLKSPQM